MNKKLFFIGLFVLAIGIGTLVYGLTVVEHYGLLVLSKGNPILTGIGSGLLVIGVGIIFGSIVWKRS